MLDPEMVPVPDCGRRFQATRRVRLGDAEPGGRLRLDALARLLQDVGNDDTADAGLDPSSPWIARRTSVVVATWPRLGEALSFTTFCGGIGGRWAERRTSIRGERGGAVEVAALWVHVDGVTGRPARITQQFHDLYGAAAGDRAVTARLGHGPPSGTVERRPWPLRATDLDVLGHVNNAATWAAVEDELARRQIEPAIAEMEYRAAIEGDDEVDLLSVVHDPGLLLWLVTGGDVRASAVVQHRGS